MNTPTEIRAILFKEGEAWVAQCLEHDIGVQAPDLDTLQFRLGVAIEAEAREGVDRHGMPFGGIPPAPDSYHRMWDGSIGTFTPAHPTPIRTNGHTIGLDLKMAS